MSLGALSIDSKASAYNGIIDDDDDVNSATATTSSKRQRQYQFHWNSFLGSSSSAVADQWRFVDAMASNSRRNEALLYVKMLVVVAIPILAVVSVFGLSLKQSYDERNTAFQQVGCSRCYDNSVTSKTDI